jgi:hypothetical protein
VGEPGVLETENKTPAKAASMGGVRGKIDGIISGI